MENSERDGTTRPPDLPLEKPICRSGAVISAFMQFIMSRQMDPTRQKGKKRRTMRQLMKEAADGKEASQDEINAVAQGQMTWMMPFMMFMIMVNLPGALVFYYLLNNIYPWS